MKFIGWNMNRILLQFFLMWSLSLTISCRSYCLDARHDWPDFANPSSIQDRVFIITPGYSGTHYLTFTLVKLTQRPFYHISANASDPLEKKLCVKFLKEEFDFTKEPIFWGHGPGRIQAVNSAHNKLMMSLRNYKEKLARGYVAQLGSKKLTEEEILQLDYISFLEDEIYNEKQAFRELIDRLMVFEKWNKKNKLLLYYEELIENPETQFRKALLFLNESLAPLSELMVHFEEHKESIINYYQDSRGARCVTKGEDTLFYSKLMPQDRLKAIDQFVEKKYPVIWKKYLSRYAS